MDKIKLLTLLSFSILVLTGCVNISSGSHNGYITAVEKSGLIWKTGTVYIKTELSSTQEDFYCVEDENVYNDLVKYKDLGVKVKIHFTDELIIAPWRCGNTVTDGDKIIGEQGIVYKVEEVKN